MAEGQWSAVLWPLVPKAVERGSHHPHPPQRNRLAGWAWAYGVKGKLETMSLASWAQGQVVQLPPCACKQDLAPDFELGSLPCLPQDPGHPA